MCLLEDKTISSTWYIREHHRHEYIYVEGLESYCLYLTTTHSQQQQLAYSRWLKCHCIVKVSIIMAISSKSLVVCIFYYREMKSSGRPPGPRAHPAPTLLLSAISNGSQKVELNAVIGRRSAWKRFNLVGSKLLAGSFHVFQTKSSCIWRWLRFLFSMHARGSTFIVIIYAFSF